MIKIENVKTYGWEAAIRGMRNPLESWEKSDSDYNVSWIDDSVWPHITGHDDVLLGENDHKLMNRLISVGDDHGKFARMITVTCDITAPLYWWKEFDTYKVGTVANSCSTMHRIHAKEFTLDDFSHEHLIPDARKLMLNHVIDTLNDMRDAYVNYDNYFGGGPKYFDEQGDLRVLDKKEVWWQMIQLLPSSYNQLRTVQLNYQVLRHMYHARKNHKLDEWREFCQWIKTLPCAELITGDPT